ncbi:hypothetical protein HG530_003955 [Fusarium avenaceum]|nr:hypothetical protein HG530_003955 [Fusarium avenaceum]
MDKRASLLFGKCQMRVFTAGILKSAGGGAGGLSRSFMVGNLSRSFCISSELSLGLFCSDKILRGGIADMDSASPFIDAPFVALNDKTQNDSALDEGYLCTSDCWTDRRDVTCGNRELSADERSREYFLGVKKMDRKVMFVKKSKYGVIGKRTLQSTDEGFDNGVPNAILWKLENLDHVHWICPGGPNA